MLSELTTIALRYWSQQGKGALKSCKFSDFPIFLGLHPRQFYTKFYTPCLRAPFNCRRNTVEGVKIGCQPFLPAPVFPFFFIGVAPQLL